MEYITGKELSERWGISQRRIIYLAQEGRIAGAKIYGKTWLFPENAAKPVDGRTKRAGVIMSEADDFFRYPSLAYCDTSKLNPSLSAEEQIIKRSMEAFHACRFEEADRILGDLPEKAGNRYCRIYALYIDCMIDFYLSETSRFYDRYARLCAEVQKEFPHKAEMESLTHEIDATLGSYEYFKKGICFRAGYAYHESFLPHLTALLAVALFYGGRQRITTDILKSYELHCLYLENTDSPANLQSFHCYFGVACAIAKKTEEANEHFRKMFELAEKYELFYVPASEYYHMQDLFDPALTQFPEVFQKKIQRISEDLHQRYMAFTGAASVNSFFSMLSHRDYAFVLCAAQGYTNREIASMLGETTGVVGMRFHSICQRFHVAGKEELVELYQSIVGESLLKR